MKLSICNKMGLIGIVLLLQTSYIVADDSFRDSLLECSNGNQIKISPAFLDSVLTIFDAHLRDGGGAYSQEEFLANFTNLDDRYVGFKLYKSCLKSKFEPDAEKESNKILTLNGDLLIENFKKDDKRNAYVLKAGTLISNNAVIRSFPLNNLSSLQGSNGTIGINGSHGRRGSSERGQDGRNGSSGNMGSEGRDAPIFIIEAKQFIGNLKIINEGQQGGNGGRGANGGNGGNGGSGRNAVSGILDCKSGPGNGGNGGDAGSGGDGGDGGRVIVHIERAETGAILTILNDGGLGGEGGQPGNAGRPGAGGPRGSAVGLCSSGGRDSGSSGQPGNIGNNGRDGSSGAAGLIEISINNNAVSASGSYNYIKNESQ